MLQKVTCDQSRKTVRIFFPGNYGKITKIYLCETNVCGTFGDASLVQLTNVLLHVNYLANYVGCML